MKTPYLSKVFFSLLLLWGLTSAAEDRVYSQLQMRSYDEMQDEVKKHVLKADQAGQDLDESRKELQDALQLIFSRPNSDNIVSNLITPVRTALKNIDSYEICLTQVAQEAIDNLANKSSKPASRSTSLVLLGNMMSELKPDITSQPKIKKIFVLIRDAKVKVSDDVKNEFRMRGLMKTPASPSDVASQILVHAK